MCIVHRRQIAARHQTFTLCNAHLLSKRRNGLRVVTRNHLDLNANLGEARERFAHLRAQFVTQAHHPKRDHARWQGRFTQRRTKGNQVLEIGEEEHPPSQCCFRASEGPQIGTGMQERGQDLRCAKDIDALKVRIIAGEATPLVG